MVAQHQNIAATEALDGSSALVMVEGNRLVIVISNEAEQGQSLLMIRQEAFFHASDRVAGAGVGMQDGVHFMRRHVHRGVDHEARRIDRIFAFGQHIAVLVDLDQR